MKIAPIDQGKFHGSALQFLRGVQSGKASPKNQDPVTRSHSLPSFRGNRRLRHIISFCGRSIPIYWIRDRGAQVLKVSGAIMVIVLLMALLTAYANPGYAKPAYANLGDGADGSTDASGPTSRAAESRALRTSSDAQPIVIGFLGGYVRHDDAVHTTVQVAQSLRQTYPNAIHVATFENRRLSDAHDLILNLLGAKTAHGLTEKQKNEAHIILYGHSWGACAVVALARQLKGEGIPVVLTVQVDSVSKAGRDDATIPDNVRYAANFYQDKGFIRGQHKIVAADASRTTILGNFYFDYSTHPIACPEYPWYTRVFMRSHIEIECDQKVWNRVEGLIREQLPTSVAGSGPGAPSADQQTNSAADSRSPSSGSGSSEQR
jgi:hypothetical protein